MLGEDTGCDVPYYRSRLSLLAAPLSPRPRLHAATEVVRAIPKVVLEPTSPITTSPITPADEVVHVTSDALVRELGALGYPGYPRSGSPPSSDPGALPAPGAGLPPASSRVSTAYSPVPSFLALDVHVYWGPHQTHGEILQIESICRMLIPVQDHER